MTANSPSVMVECAVGAEVEQVYWLDTSGVVFPRIEIEIEISELEQGYIVLNPLTVRVRPLADDVFEAAFTAANIAITGNSVQDAYQSLIAEILDTFDALEAEPQLSPVAAAQRQTLRTHIGRA